MTPTLRWKMTSSVSTSIRRRLLLYTTADWPRSAFPCSLSRSICYTNHMQSINSCAACKHTKKTNNSNIIIITIITIISISNYSYCYCKYTIKSYFRLLPLSLLDTARTGSSEEIYIHSRLSFTGEMPFPHQTRVFQGYKSFIAMLLFVFAFSLYILLNNEFMCLITALQSVDCLLRFQSVHAKGYLS